MPEIKKGNNSANNVGGVTSFNICIMAGHALHCTKFCEIISNGIKVMDGHDLYTENYKGELFRKKCRWSDCC